MPQASLFSALQPTFAEGFFYEPDFLTWPEETELLEAIQKLPLEHAEYKEFTARRQVIAYGGRYDYDANTLHEAEPIPPFLLPLRQQVAQWTGRRAEDFTHAMIAEYTPGTPLGWHRDVPDFEMVVGVSLMSACRMRFRRYPPRPHEKSTVIELAPRSIYRMEGEARWGWQHSVPAVPDLRYSITFRTRVRPAR